MMKSLWIKNGSLKVTFPIYTLKKIDKIIDYRCNFVKNNLKPTK